MKKLLAVLAALSVMTFAIDEDTRGSGGYTGVSLMASHCGDTREDDTVVSTETTVAEIGDSGGPLFAGNGCVDNNDNGCDNTQGNQMSLAVVIISGDEVVIDGDDSVQGTGFIGSDTDNSTERFA